jgi:aspartyl protease family protein
MPGFTTLCIGLSAVAAAALTQPTQVTRPPAPATERRTEIRIPADEYSQFWISGTVDGSVPVRFLIDTGASDVMIPKSLAQQLGMLRGLKFTAPHSTANGVTNDAPARLKSLEIAGLAMRDVEIDVSGGKLELALLGMTWLKRFDVTVSDGVMVLTPKAGQLL